MFFAPDRDPMDVPAPQSPDQVAEAFAVPLVTLVAQASLEEAAVSTATSTQNGVTTMEEATLSYTLWRNPADHDDPVNLAELTDELRAAVESVPMRPLPE